MFDTAEPHVGREPYTVRQGLLSSLPAGHSARRLALAVVAASAAIFLAAAPFAKTPLPPVPAFLPIYQSALVLVEVITAVLLFSQFAILRTQALLVLGSAYLFSAFMAVFHALSFPGLFSQTGLLGAGPQTTAWIYFLWHGGFPLLIIVYALLRDGARDGERVRGSPSVAVLVAIAGAMGAAGALAYLTTAGHDSLPVIMAGDKDASTKVFVAACTWTLSVVAATVLWRRRQYSVLDLWLMVVMCVWIFDVALASVLNGGRYDVGWYAGRVYGLLAASFVLLVLLTENGTLYARLLGAHEGEHAQRLRAEETTVALAAANRELEAFSYSVSHDLRAPLRAVDGFAKMLEEDYSATLDDEGKRLLSVVRANSTKMGQLIDDLLEFARVGRAKLLKANVDVAALVDEVIAEVAEDRRAVFEVAQLPAARGDRGLLKQVWVNLVSNAVKYSGKRDQPRIQIGAKAGGGENIYWVRDNGAGFDMRYAGKLFGVFQRLHGPDEFPGTGVGLAIVQRVIARHGGRAWAEGKVDEGAAFFVSLPAEG